jgi:translation initiation factor eIF-2B subunit delta
MRNFLKFLKASILCFQHRTDSEAKQNILDEVSRFRKALLTATEYIAEYGVKKIYDGDVIMTYAASYNVQRILLHAHSLGKKFSVIVVDSPPKFEGRTLLKQLSSAGITCIYAHITAVSYLIQESSKVLLGAHSLLSNGAVVSRSGTAIIAMMAHNDKVPVLVACETFKFHNRAQLDSICWNELEDPNALISLKTTTAHDQQHVLSDWKSIEKLTLLNLAYDVTPMDHVSVVVTELGLIPPTSVPVIIDAQQGDTENEGYEITEVRR